MKKGTKNKKRQLEKAGRPEDEATSKCSHASDSYNYIKRPGRNPVPEPQTRQTGSIYNNVVSGLYIILHFYKAAEPFSGETKCRLRTRAI